jgi:uncharacterized membrane protein YhaH (DUF805 family)
MTMGQAVATCLRKYSDFSGRGRRSEFWWFVLAEALVSIPLQIWALVALAPAFEHLDRDFASNDWVSLKRVFEDVDWDEVMGPLALLGVISLLMFIPMLAAGSRRLHDMGQSGWWQVLMVVGPLSIVPIIMWILDSQPHENRFGPDPKAGERVGWGYGYSQPPA